jgi:hypothetical protein
MLANQVTKTKFKRDTSQRARYFSPESFKHNGKANLNLISSLLEDVPAGRLVIDPMGGTGSLLIATDYQYPVITGELEAHWAAVCEANRQLLSRGRLFSASTPAMCCRWDTGRLPLAAHSIPAIITSPPYWDMLSDWHIKSKGLQADIHEVYGPAYGIHPLNLGNIHIYEDYLRAMATVYTEFRRVLSPGGILVLILKDRIHKLRRVPIVRDTIALVTALGFRLIKQIEREVTPSLHRRVNQLHHPEAETVDTEAALIFKEDAPPFDPDPCKFAIVQAPKPDSAPSWQLYTKQLAYVTRRAERTFVLTKQGLTLLQQGETPVYSSFRRRKEFAFACAFDLVTKYGFAAGDEIELHCSMTYGQYLRERLTTLGGQVSIPTEGLNLGQKLQWYTERDCTSGHRRVNRD